ncbi:hypothetical protein EDEG_02669 [Edhazardia aedis USNM 41457]|uniref:Nucleoporin NSP1-like C-terminal domain-containing protein n=1 Tax=Edhazardia aedis (strain USNM 41457) TaxID=1003232 RepID=J9DJZ5_EDHAE|nr:hypothetical protein EDEG_02669 [Edhazardia aedis USNM 41457]|eukprot:EJW02940.1 hypothetical protein EDEG_02669 [Edhazardia aedis USNM 41457]
MNNLSSIGASTGTATGTNIPSSTANTNTGLFGSTTANNLVGTTTTKPQEANLFSTPSTLPAFSTQPFNTNSSAQSAAFPSSVNTDTTKNTDTAISSNAHNFNLINTQENQTQTQPKNSDNTNISNFNTSSNALKSTENNLDTAKKVTFDMSKTTFADNLPLQQTENSQNTTTTNTNNIQNTTITPNTTTVKPDLETEIPLNFRTKYCHEIIFSLNNKLQKNIESFNETATALYNRDEILKRARNNYCLVSQMIEENNKILDDIDQSIDIFTSVIDNIENNTNINNNSGANTGTLKKCVDTVEKLCDDFDAFCDQLKDDSTVVMDLVNDNMNLIRQIDEDINYLQNI